MPRELKKYLIFICLLTILNSCRVVPYLYIPNNMNMPLMGNKHEIKADVNIDVAGDNIGVNASYAVGDHFLVYADGLKIRSFKNTPYHDINESLTHVGVGYFKRIGNYGRVELLGGGGYGATNSTIINHLSLLFDGSNSIENLNISSKLYSASVQADIGFVSRYFDCGLGIRLTDLMPSGNYTATYTDTANKFLRQKIMPMSGHALLLEPALIMAAGSEYAKFSLQFGLLYQLNGLKVDPYYGPLYEDGFLTVGLTVNLFREYKKIPITNKGG